MTSTYSYNVAGEPVGLVHTKTTNCSADCDWYTDHVTVAVDGKWLAEDSTLASRSFAYDAMGRLEWVSDTGAELCTTRQYTYDANSNRTSVTSRSPNSDGTCNTTATGAVITTSYDAADRTTTAGFSLDDLGRTVEIPATHNGGVALEIEYFENDAVSSLTDGSSTTAYTLDPLDE